MILKTEDDIDKVIKRKATTAACVCSDCGLQYTVSIKLLKETRKLLCRKCYAKAKKQNPKNEVIVPKHIKEFKKRGFVNDKIYFDSLWKLAYYIWLIDNNKKFVYQPNTPIDYIDKDGTTRQYYPDFLVEGRFIEIKGNQFFNENNEPYNLYKKEYWWSLYNALLNNKVYIMREQEAFTYVKYVNEKYGKEFFKQRKIG